jgi:hypothetical protein
MLDQPTNLGLITAEIERQRDFAGYFSGAGNSVGGFGRGEDQPVTGESCAKSSALCSLFDPPGTGRQITPSSASRSTSLGVRPSNSVSTHMLSSP